MNQKIIAIGIVLIAACLSGCIDEEDKETYRCTVDEGVLYLRGDVSAGEGMYRMLIDEMHGGGGIHGTYGIEDGQVLLDSALNMVIRFTVDGRDLIDPDGDRWVRD